MKQKTAGYNLPDGLYHFQSHLDAVVCMVWPRNWEARDAVVAVSQNLNSHALVLLSEIKLIKLITFIRIL